MKAIKFIGKFVLKLFAVGWLALGTSCAIQSLIETLTGGDQ